MNVLMQMETGAQGVPGGHRRQMEKTAHYLRLLGLNVDISFNAREDLTEYDLVHSFGITENILHNARHQCKPIAISTIYWSYHYALNYTLIAGRFAHLSQLSKQRVKMLLSVLARGHTGLKQQANFWIRHAETSLLYRNADILLPNAHAEGEELIAECGVERERVHFVPNATESSITEASPAAFVAEYGMRDFLLCVGRVEPRKNQLRLIQAAKLNRQPLVIVDPVHPDHADYRATCERALGSESKILEKLSDEMLSSAYAAAKVHALPSFFETTGLVTLEAALADCNVVVNDQAHTREYFGDFAWYCDPTSVPSIRRALVEASSAENRPGLKERVLSQFTWQHTAKATLEGYERVLAG